MWHCLPNGEISFNGDYKISELLVLTRGMSSKKKNGLRVRKMLFGKEALVFFAFVFLSLQCKRGLRSWSRIVRSE